MTAKTQTVRARMTTKDGEALDRLARERGTTASEVLRHLITAERERSERAKASARFSYFTEKLGEALVMLTLDEEPRTMSLAFSVIGRGMNGGPTILPEDDMATPRRWFKEAKALIEPSDEDAKDPDAKTLGTGWVRARRMTTDEKARLKGLLWDLYAFAISYAR